MFSWEIVDEITGSGIVSNCNYLDRDLCIDDLNDWVGALRNQMNKHINIYRDGEPYEWITVGMFKKYLADNREVEFHVL